MISWTSEFYLFIWKYLNYLPVMHFFNERIRMAITCQKDESSQNQNAPSKTVKLVSLLRSLYLFLQVSVSFIELTLAISACLSGICLSCLIHIFFAGGDCEDWQAVRLLWRWQPCILQAHQWGRPGILHFWLRGPERQDQPNLANRRCALLVLLCTK